MNNVLQFMLDKYEIKSQQDQENAIKEIIQEIALSGLSRGGFFKKAAFYGGTCLRMFYGLNRFSEDLDFALLEKDPDFRFDAYFPALIEEFSSYGIEVSVDSKNIGSHKEVQSPFIKGNTSMLMLTFFPNGEENDKIVFNQKIKVKFEIDTDNPEGGTTEINFKMLPSPYEVQVFDEPTLFAGKIHAILCRGYENHVKGRDYYDYLFYVGKGSKINLPYLESKLKNTGKMDESDRLTMDRVKSMLRSKFETIDFESAKDDVLPFIQDKKSVAVWKKELFLATIGGLRRDRKGNTSGFSRSPRSCSINEKL